MEEGLANVLAHAGTDQASVSLDRPTPRLIRLRLADAGRGFTAEGLRHESTPTTPPAPPNLTISVPVAETRESSIAVTGTAGPSETVVVNGSAVKADVRGNWRIVVSIPAEGPNEITASNGLVTRSVTVVRDIVPPVLELTASATRTDAERVVLTAAGEEGARILIEGQEVATLTVTLQMGNNRFTATATDRAGNQSTATVTVLRIEKAPEVRALWPPAR